MSIKNQEFLSPMGWYRIEYPPTWEVEVIEGIPAFFDGLFSKGGVFQLFAIRIPKNGIPDPEILKKAPYLKGENVVEKMEAFLEHQGSGGYVESIQSYTKDNALVSVCEWKKEDTFYFGSMMENYQKFILALYNAPYVPDAEEAGIIGGMVRSLEIYPD